MILIFATPEEARELLGLSTRQPEIVRPQTSGPCVHYDDKHPDEPCTYPYGDGTCPHMDNPEITCPIHDACEAMYCVMRARDECEAEQEEQDAAMAADPEVPAVPLSSEADAVPRSDYVLAPPAADTGARVPEFEPADDPDVDMESAHTGRLHTYEVNPEPEIPGPAPEEEPVYEVASTRKTAWSHAEDAAMWTFAGLRRHSARRARPARSRGGVDEVRHNHAGHNRRVRTLAD